MVTLRSETGRELVRGLLSAIETNATVCRTKSPWLWQTVDSGGANVPSRCGRCAYWVGVLIQVLASPVAYGQATLLQGMDLRDFVSPQVLPFDWVLYRNCCAL
jgi:hypothetical protein